MMDSIAAAAMSLSAASLQQSYSVAMAKKSMETQELAAQGLLEMLPRQAPMTQEGHIDVYA